MKKALMTLMVAIGLLFSTISVMAQTYKVVNTLTANTATARQIIDNKWEILFENQPSSVEFKFCSDQVIRTNDQLNTTYKIGAFKGENAYGIPQWEAVSSQGKDVIFSMQESDEDGVIFIGIFFIERKLLLTFITETEDRVEPVNKI